MTVASLELCKTLHELSGWERPSFYWQYTKPDGDWLVLPQGQTGEFEHYPAYDLGYLLRKLPMQIEQPTTTYFFQLTEGVEAKWHIDYRDENDGQYTAVDADTPEDAACRLAIELFKEGILKPREK